MFPNGTLAKLIALSIVGGVAKALFDDRPIIQNITKVVKEGAEEAVDKS